MNQWVFVDTCVWASFFCKPTSSEKYVVDKLLDADRIAIIGPIITETLMGFRRRDQAAWVASRLRNSHYVQIDWDDWRGAADLGRTLTAAGNKLPLTDILIATFAIRRSASVYTTDPHFLIVPQLKRYLPGP
jgi:predicted nucleic acid-binding protein